MVPGLYFSGAACMTRARAVGGGIGISDIALSGYRVTGLSGLAGLARLAGLAELAELGELGDWLDTRSHRGWRLELGVRVHQPRDMFQG